MMHLRLFGDSEWLSTREASDAIGRKLFDLGLQEHVAGSADTTRATALGNELHLDLVLVFLGVWDEWEMPGILLQYGLIDELEEEQIYNALAKDTDAERILKPIVQSAFRDHYNCSRLLA